jgi:hypothetical protein
MKIPDGGRRANAVKPQGGDTVFLRGDEKRTAMYLERTYVKNQIEYGTCTWTEYEMFEDELIGTEMKKEFLVSDLTLFIDPPRKK